MPGKVPFFLSGGNAKLRVNGVTLVFCTDVSYSVVVRHATPRILGVYEAASQEPLSYEVKGSFSIIRYARKLQSFLLSEGNLQSPEGVNDQGNGIGTWFKGKGDAKAISTITGGSMGGSSRADQSFDPSKLYFPSMFNIEISQQAPKADGGTDSGIIARFRDCRVTGSDFKLTKKSVATQLFYFQAIYVDEDSFTSGIGGVGQLV